MSANDETASSSNTVKILDPEICQSCGFAIRHPCEIFQMVDCPRCGDDIYDCDICQGTGKNLLVLQDGKYPPCDTCDGCGKLRGCKECEGSGQRFVPGAAHGIHCEDCQGHGWKSCEICHDRGKVKRFLGLCPGDTFCSGPRPHRRITKHPGKSEEAREEWGEVIRPYEPTME